jgi:hypothetical protein
LRAVLVKFVSSLLAAEVDNSVHDSSLANSLINEPESVYIDGGVLGEAGRTEDLTT